VLVVIRWELVGVVVGGWLGYDMDDKSMAMHSDLMT
jgi:hypothetical protein